MKINKPPFASPIMREYLRIPSLVVLALVIGIIASTPMLAEGVVYVNKAATGANNGNSWADAYTMIQAGIDDADIMDEEVWVAQGTYSEAIVMKSGVQLYSGFNGTETSRDQRNWTTNVTTIDGSTARGGLPAYHVVTIDSITSSTIDGFTITGGNANGEGTTSHGGGIFCFNLLNDTNIIKNNTITGNSAGWGGGISCYYYSSPNITNNTISGNSAWEHGGGIYCYSHSSPTITNNTVSGNSAWDDGGGIYCIDSSPTITNNTISGNSADGEIYGGGGISCWGFSSPTITNNTISGNSAHRGGGISCYSSSPTITNNTISENSGGWCAGGISCWHSSSATITNNTISGNSAGWVGGGGILCDSYSSPTIANNTISGNSANSDIYGGGGIRCGSYSSPTITNNTISGNSAYRGGGISCWHYSSPTITNNAISGNSASWYGGGISCWDYSSPTITNNTISGNWAYPGGGIICRDYSSPRIKNTIFYNNIRYDIYEQDTSSDPIVSYNDFYGNSDGVYYDEGLFSYTSASAMDAAIAECSNNIGLDPLFIGDTLSGGTWSAVGDYNQATFQTTLTDSSASWAANEHAGRLLNPDTLHNKQFMIVSNTATTCSVWGDVSAIAQIGDAYKIFDYHLQSSSPCIDAGYDQDVPDVDFDGEPRPIDVLGVDNNGPLADYDIGADEYSGVIPPPTPTPTSTPTSTGGILWQLYE